MDVVVATVVDVVDGRTDEIGLTGCNDEDVVVVVVVAGAAMRGFFPSPFLSPPANSHPSITIVAVVGGGGGGGGGNGWTEVTSLSVALPAVVKEVSSPLLLLLLPGILSV